MMDGSVIMPDHRSLNSGDLLEIERDYCVSLRNFTKRAWRVLEPGRELKWNWALDAICDHLEAVYHGDILRMMFNVPPGCMKSLLCGVMFPAWVWGPMKGQRYRFLGTSHKEPLAVRDNIKCRRIIQSEWYQKLWPVNLSSDQNAKTKFENSELGFREAMAFRSMTGSRGDFVLLDDPLSVDDAKSEAELASAEFTFKEALPSRINDPDKSAIIVIMQRLHERDTSGIIIKDYPEYEKFILPMRFEEERRCYTCLGQVDIRKKDGELLFPERFSEDYVTKEERGMGAYATAGQFQQRPAPRGGGAFKEEWFTPIKASELPPRRKRVRAWDLAGSDRKKSPYSVGILMSMDSNDNIYLEHVVRVRKSPGAIEKLMKKIGGIDGKSVVIDFPQDPGQAGKYQAEVFKKKLKPFRSTFSPESGSKEVRAEGLAGDAELGMVYMVEGPWNKTFIDEAVVFPAGTYKDQIDAASRGYHHLQSSSRYTLENVG